MKRILVPLDLTANARHALAYAQAMFHETSCRFYLQHAKIHVPVGADPKMGTEGGPPIGAAEGNNPFLQYARDLRTHNKNVLHHFETIAVSDTLINAINTILISKEIDYLVLATQGTQGIKEIFLGGTTTKIINGVDYFPILVIPGRAVIRPPEQIAFSTNFNRAFDAKELQPLIALIKMFRAKLKVVQLMERDTLSVLQKTNKQALIKLLLGLDIYFQEVRVYSSERGTLGELARFDESDMIALINHRQNFLVKLLRENVIEKMVFGSPVPILILPALR